MGRHSDQDGDGIADHHNDDSPLGEYVVCDDRPRDENGALLDGAPVRHMLGGQP
jgi:hypothetical protein